MRRFSLALLLALVGCNPGPQVGDVYEDPMSREREAVVQRGPCRYAYLYLVGYGFLPDGEVDTLGERLERETGVRRSAGYADFTADDSTGSDCVATITEPSTLGMRTGRMATPGAFAQRKLVKVN